MRRPSLRSTIATDLSLGDNSDRHAARQLLISSRPHSRDRVRRIALALHTQLPAVTLDQARANRGATSSPSMMIRHLGDVLYGLARGQHCHAGIYRTEGAHSLLTEGGLSLQGNAQLHCEHTIPVCVLVDQLWMRVHAQPFRSAADLLAWTLQHLVITVALQAERHALDTDRVSLRREREILGTNSRWSCTHPDLINGRAATETTRPFLRYLGTGVRIIHVPSRGMSTFSDQPSGII